MELWSHDQREIAKMTELIYQTDRINFLEVGSAMYRLTSFFLGMAIGKVITIDKEEGEKRTRIRKYLEKTFPKHFYPIIGNSYDPLTVKRVADILNGEKIDVLYIDGDHRYGPVEKDTENYTPFIEKSGVIFWHDAVQKRDGVWLYLYKLKEIGCPIRVMESDFPGRVNHKVGLGYIRGIEWLKSKAYRNILENRDGVKKP